MMTTTHCSVVCLQSPRVTQTCMQWYKILSANIGFALPDSPASLAIKLLVPGCSRGLLSLIHCSAAASCYAALCGAMAGAEGLAWKCAASRPHQAARTAPPLVAWTRSAPPTGSRLPLQPRGSRPPALPAKDKMREGHGTDRPAETVHRAGCRAKTGFWATRPNICTMVAEAASRCRGASYINRAACPPQPGSPTMPGLAPAGQDQRQRERVKECKCWKGTAQQQRQHIWGKAYAR